MGKIPVSSNHYRLRPLSRNEMMKMKKYTRVLINVLLLSTFLFAKNVPPGTIDGEVWSKDSSPYYILGDLEIVNLIILPGVSVLFKDNFKFEVTGTLTAQGFYSDSIYFKPAPDNQNGWQGISFTSESINSVLSYCRIEGANNQGIAIDQSSVNITNCDLISNNGDGIFITNAWLSSSISNCLFADNAGNGVSLNASVATFNNVIISDNSENGVYSPEANNAIKLSNVVIADNMQTGVYAPNGGNITIINSIIYYNTPDVALMNDDKIISYSDIGGSGLFPGLGNLNVDPQFVDHDRYLLSELSPCIDMGKSNEDIYFPPSLGSEKTDMGTYGGQDAGLWYPALYIKQDTLDFGKVTIDSSRSRLLMVHNYRDEDIIVNTISFAGENADVFSTNQTGFILSAGESKDITVLFRPLDETIYRAELILSTADHGLFSNHLQGQGAVPKISISDSLLDFGTVFVGDTAQTGLIVSNRGGDTLYINKISTGDSVFLAEVGSLRVSPDMGKDTIEIAFVPSWLENYQDTLVIESNDPQKPQLKIALNGKGIGSVIGLDRDMLDFKAVSLGADSTLMLKIRNSGNSVLEIQDLEILPLVYTPSAFRLKNKDISFPLLIEPAAEFELLVTFRPDSAHSDSAYLKITSNDPLHPSKEVLLKGTAVGPVLSIPYTDIDFGDVPILVDTVQSFSIRNSGNTILVIDSLLIRDSGAHPPTFEFVNANWFLPLNIQPDSGYTISIRYKPDKANSDSAYFLVTSNDPLNPQRKIKLSGKSLAPQIEADQAQLDFGHIPINSEAVKTVLLYNRGKGDLIIFADSLSLLGPDTAAFQLKALPADMQIAPGDSDTIAVQVKTSLLGPKNALLKVVSNDPANRFLSIPLLALVYENEPAEIIFDPQHSSTQFIKGQKGNLSFRITSRSALDSASLLIRHSGKSAFTNVPLTVIAGTDFWATEIEAKWITERGFEYYVEAYYGWTSTIAPENGEKQPVSVQVAVPTLVFPQPTKKELYQKISVPVLTSGQTLADLFEDNLGPYDTKKYRLFDCIDGQNYTELSQLDIELPPGKALWLVTRNSVTLDLDNGLSLPADQPYSVSLKRGWNMIATPFAFPVSWADIDAVHPLRYFDGVDWLFVSALEPYKGYAVYVERDTTINIVAEEGTSARKVHKPNPLLAGEKWHIQLSVQTKSLKDMFNFAGVHPRANDRRDCYDYPEPPPIGSFAALYFVDEQQKHFSTNYRKPDQKGYVFPFEVLNNENEEMTIFLTPSNLPADFGWLVLSPETGIKYKGNVIRCSATKCRYQLVVGTKEFLREVSASYKTLPVKFELRQNYPNPFNPVTRIAFQLPNTEKVSLNVFNILGQRIKTLINNRALQAGYYSLRWDGDNDYGKKVSAGIYFLQFRSDNYYKTIKMIMQK